jgi:hypothetical protein
MFRKYIGVQLWYDARHWTQEMMSAWFSETYILNLAGHKEIIKYISIKHYFGNVCERYLINDHFGFYKEINFQYFNPSFLWKQKYLYQSK